MRAAYYERTGQASDVLLIGEFPTPTPGPGEVRVKVSWSGVNPSDVKTRAGQRTKALPFSRIIPHSDGAGVIDQVGPNVAPARIGERVWIWNAAWMRPFGTAAQYVVLPSSQAVPLPRNVDLATGACLGIPALTAYHTVAVEGGVANKNILVAGGAGAVGHYAIQLAKLKGAKQIIATVSGPEKAVLAREAGADIVLNYKVDDLRSAIQDATAGQGVDRIIEVDFAANVDADIAILRPNGEVIIYGSGASEIRVPFSPAIRKGARMVFFIVYSLDLDVRERAIADLWSKSSSSNSPSSTIAATVPMTDLAAKAIRWGVSEMGLSLVIDGRECPGCDSPRRFCLGTQTDIQCPGNLKSDDVVKGIAQIVSADKAFGRISENTFFIDPTHLSDISRNRVIDLLNATGAALRNLGHPVDVNAGIKAANQVLGIS